MNERWAIFKQHEEFKTRELKRICYGCTDDSTFEEVKTYPSEAEARKAWHDEPLYIDELSDEYDPRIGEDAFFLNLPHVTVGQLKRFIADLPDDTEISVWDTDSRSSKECVGFFMNGPFLTLETETWGRTWLKH